MTTPERLQLLEKCSSLFEPWTGPFDAGKLLEWLTAELGDPEALDQPVPHGPLRSIARAPAEILHVVSENTPHAAFQSLLRGLTVGARNTVKLPSSGLPELVSAVAEIPPGLASLVELVPVLPSDWTESAEVLVVFGSDDTLAWFTSQTPPHVRLLAHGQKFSIARVGGEVQAAARLGARDVSLFDQSGCLSVHDIYVAEEAGVTAREFAALLAEEMRAFNEHTPRGPLTPAESGALASLREVVRFAAAAEPDRFALWESAGSTEWTVVYEHSPAVKLSPLNRFVYVKPWPASGTAEAFDPQRHHLSTIALHPFDESQARSLLDLGLGATRICPLGATQNPSLFWHHDGLPPLASLVTWIDFG